MSRVEALSDGVFAFALTLLIVSLEVPKNSSELLRVIMGFPAFAACFAILVHLWYSHHRFYRRYALSDPVTVALNSALLFLVLFFVYPLKFLFTMLVGFALLRFGILSGEEARDYGREIESMIVPRDAKPLMLVYSAGYLGVSLVFALLYARAWRRREALELDARERHVTRAEIVAHGADGGVAVLSLALAIAGHVAAAGWCYFLLGPIRTLLGVLRARRMPPPEGAVAGGSLS